MPVGHYMQGLCFIEERRRAAYHKRKRERQIERWNEKRMLCVYDTHAQSESEREKRRERTASPYAGCTQTYEEKKKNGKRGNVGEEGTSGKNQPSRGRERARVRK